MNAETREYPKCEIRPRWMKYTACNCCGKPEDQGVVRFRAWQVQSHGEYITNSYECPTCAALSDEDYYSIRAEGLQKGEAVWMQGDIFDGRK